MACGPCWYHNMLNPSLTRGEYWLLEAVAEFALPIRVLESPRIGEALNKPGHGMSRSLLVETMRNLFEQGLIMAHRFGDWDNCLELSPEQIEAALDEQDDIKQQHYYALTENGGRHWEAFARPDWNWYISAGYDYLEDNESSSAELVCAAEDHLKSYLRLLRSHEYDVDEGSIQFDTVAPWKATYWKTLPLGHRVRFRCTKKEHVDVAFVQWYDERWYRWR